MHPLPPAHSFSRLSCDGFGLSPSATHGLCHWLVICDKTTSRWANIGFNTEAKTRLNFMQPIPHGFCLCFSNMLAFSKGNKNTRTRGAFLLPKVAFLNAGVYFVSLYSDGNEAGLSLQSIKMLRFGTTLALYIICAPS